MHEWYLAMHGALGNWLGNKVLWFVVTNCCSYCLLLHACDLCSLLQTYKIMANHQSC